MKHMFIKRERPYFRTRIPLRLAGIVGRNEIRLALKTFDLQKAATVCRLLHKYTRKVFDTMGTDRISPPSMAELRAKLDEAADWLLFTVENRMSDDACDHGTAVPGNKDEFSARIDRMIADSERSIAEDDHTIAETDFSSLGDDVLRSVPPKVRSALAKEYYPKRIYVLQIAKEHLSGNYDTEYDSKHKATPSHTPTVRRKVEYIPPSPRGIPTSYTGEDFDYNNLVANLNHDKICSVQKPSTSAPSKILASCAGEFIDFKISSGEWTAKTRISRKTVLKLLVEHFGENCDPASITASQMMNFREKVLRNLPARRNVDPAMRDKKLGELLAAKSPRLLSIATINDYMTVCSSFFQWGVKFKDWPRNPASGLLLQDNRSAGEKKSPYSQSDIENIFRHWNDLPHNTDNRESRNTQFGWIVLIAAFSGMRQNEICQLSVDDVVRHNSVPCFVVRNNHPTKSIKNQQSRRLVPIHPELLRYGFLSFVNRQRALREVVILKDTPPLRQLFPCCIWNEVGHYNRNFERAFTKYNEEYVTKDSLKRFHSLRHNVATTLSNLEGVESHQVSRILGHVQTTETNRTYAKTDITRLQAILSRMKYDCDPFLLRRMTPLNEEEISAQTSRLPVLETF